MLVKVGVGGSYYNQGIRVILYLIQYNNIILIPLV